VGEAKRRGGAGGRKPGDAKAPPGTESVAGVADRSERGRKMLEAIRELMPESGQHIDLFLASRYEFLIVGLCGKAGSARQAFLTVAADRDDLVTAALPHIFREHIRGTGPFIVAVDESWAAELELIVDRLRFGPAVVELDGRVPPDHIGIVVAVEGAAGEAGPVLAAIAIADIEAALAVFEQDMHIGPADRGSREKYGELLRQAADILRNPPLSVEACRHGAAMTAFWCAMHHPRRAAEIRGLLSHLIRQHATAYINAAAGPTNTWSFGVADKPMDLRGLHRGLQPGFGHMDNIPDILPDRNKMD